MKLLVVMSFKEYQKKVAQLLDQAKITVFSATETMGVKDQQESNLLDNWFSSGSEQFDSVFQFSFTDAAKADQALSLIKKYNTENETGFPIRAFVLSVEKST